MKPDIAHQEAKALFFMIIIISVWQQFLFALKNHFQTAFHLVVSVLSFPREFHKARLNFSNIYIYMYCPCLSSGYTERQRVRKRQAALPELATFSRFTVIKQLW